MLLRLSLFLLLLASIQTADAQQNWPPPYRTLSAGYVYTGFHEAELGLMLNFMRWYTPAHERDDIDPGRNWIIPVVYTHSIVLGAGYAPAEELTAFRLGYQYTTQQRVIGGSRWPLFFGRISGETHTDFVHWVPSLTVEAGLQIKITKRPSRNRKNGFLENSFVSISGGVMFSPRDAAFGQQRVSPLVRLNWMFGRTHSGMFHG